MEPVDEKNETIIETEVPTPSIADFAETPVLGKRADGKMRRLGPDGYELRKGSTRPHGIHPDLWRVIAKTKAGIQLNEESKHLSLEDFQKRVFEVLSP